MLLVGVDLGGTKVEACFLEVSRASKGVESLKACLHGETVHLTPLVRRRRPTERIKGYKHIVGVISQLLSELVEEQGVALSELRGVGIGVPGVVDPQTGVFLKGNTTALIGKRLAYDVAGHLNYDANRFVLANDANCFTLAESLLGQHGLGDESRGGVLGLILGTGVGGGYWCGELLSGTRGAALEVGHTLLVEGGHPCYCGRLGCAEQYLSGPALEASFASRLYSQLDHRPGAAQIFSLADEGEPLALAQVTDYQRRLGSFIANLCQVLDPALVVLGGGVSLQSRIYKGIESLIASQTFLGLAPLVRQHRLGDSSGVLGAALLPLFSKEHTDL